MRLDLRSSTAAARKRARIVAKRLLLSARFHLLYYLNQN